jgi:colanic acid/amylovoran biosynthesis glycosyltransferase
MVVPAFPKLSETFIVSKFLGLLERGFDVTVACDRSDPAEWDRVEELSLHPELRRRVVTAWPTRPRSWAMLLWPLAMAWCAAKNPSGLARYFARGWTRFGPGVLRRFYLDCSLIALHPDLVHFEFGTLGVGRSWIGGALGCKVVASFRGFDLNMAGLGRPEYYRDLWLDADALHLLGDDLWRRALRRGCPSDKPHVLIPPAVDVGVFERGGQELETGSTRMADRPFRILSVGRLHWKKGYDDALMAVRRLCDRGIHCEYRIVGDGDYLEAIAYARHQLGLGDRLRLMGPLSRKEVREQFAWADVLLHAAVSEGFCNAVVESQAMSVPVVCTDADGLPENVGDAETGFVVPRRDPDAMAEKLALLASDPALRKQMGEAGRRRVLELFDRSTQIDSFVEFYRRVFQGLESPGRLVNEPSGSPARAGRRGATSGAPH